MVASRRSKQRPIVPGTSIGALTEGTGEAKLSDEGTGTLCCLVEDADGGLFGLTVGHFQSDRRLPYLQRLRMIQPGFADGGTERDVIGYLAKSLLFQEDYERRYDVGIFKLSAGISWNNQILGRGPIAGVGTAKANDFPLPSHPPQPEFDYGPAAPFGISCFLGAHEIRNLAFKGERNQLIQNRFHSQSVDVQIRCGMSVRGFGRQEACRNLGCSC